MKKLIIGFMAIVPLMAQAGTFENLSDCTAISAHATAEFSI